MKKTIVAALMMLSFQAFAQTPIAGILNRFTDPDKGHTVFVEKGNHAIGFSGNYYNFNAAGYTDGDGFSLLSLLNMGDGVVHAWNVVPRLSWFVADDISIGANLLYSGYVADTNINLDFREVLPVLYEWLGDGSDIANVGISSRHMVHHNWGLAFSARKYISFFGSKTFGVFGEARLFAKYGNTFSCPRNAEKLGKTRTSQTAQVGVDIAGGLAVKLKDNSALTISVPIIGLTWNGAWQNSERRYEAIKKDEEGKSMKNPDGSFIKEEVVVPGGGKMSYLRVSRATNVLDLIGIQIGYTHFIGPKPKKK